MSGSFCAGGGAIFSQCGKDCRGGRHCRPACPVSPELPLCGAAATVPPAAPSFLSCQKRRGRKEALDTDRIVPQATEGPRRRALRPAHEKLSAKLHYSAACVETTLPSIAVAAQRDGKTRCCGNGRPSAYSPVVPNICRADVGIGPCKVLCINETGRVFRK